MHGIEITIERKIFRRSFRPCQKHLCIAKKTKVSILNGNININN